jgi:hypothetical protein
MSTAWLAVAHGATKCYSGYELGSRDSKQLCTSGVVFEDGRAPVGPNIPANATGYREIAATCEEKLEHRW